MISELCLLNELGYYLECVSISSGDFSSLILEFPTLQVACSSFPISISFLHLIFSIPFHFAIYILLYVLVCGFFHSVVFIHPLLPLFLNSAPCIIITLFLWFSLCPSEVNLHTYLTTWLSSCPVGIFVGFSP